MVKLIKRNSKTIIRHLSFWLIYITVFTIIYGRLNQDYSRMLYQTIAFALPYILLSTYTILLVILPKFLVQKRQFWAFLLSFCTLFFFTIVETIDIVAIRGDKEMPSLTKLVQTYYFFFLFLENAVVTGIALLIHLTGKWNEIKQQHIELQKRNIETELNLLKTQLDSHFLFNTLNNLYGLALSGSDKTASSILKLSEILSYVLYECKAKFVSLDKEIHLIKNYIELGKLRYGKRLKVIENWNVKSNGELIPPMILFTFVENSFKHGTGKDTGSPWVNIALTEQNKKIEFIIENGVDNKFKSRKGGVGLENVKKRLDLLYKDNYSLNYLKTRDSFRVELNLIYK